MVHALQDEDPQIAQIAGHEIRHDLSTPILQRLIAAGEPVQQQLDAPRAGALRNHILAGSDFPYVLAAFVHGSALFLGQFREVRQFAQQGAIHHLTRHRFICLYEITNRITMARAASASTPIDQMAISHSRRWYQGPGGAGVNGTPRARPCRETPSKPTPYTRE